MKPIIDISPTEATPAQMYENTLPTVSILINRLNFSKNGILNFFPSPSFPLLPVASPKSTFTIRINISRTTPVAMSAPS